MVLYCILATSFKVLEEQPTLKNQRGWRMNFTQKILWTLVGIFIMYIALWATGYRDIVNDIEALIAFVLIICTFIADNVIERDRVGGE
jgi:cell division protein FtsW (lipid II flippase)